MPAKLVSFTGQLRAPLQCGFTSTIEGNLLTQDEQWGKLKLVVHVATKVSGKA